MNLPRKPASDNLWTAGPALYPRDVPAARTRPNPNVCLRLATDEIQKKTLIRGQDERRPDAEIKAAVRLHFVAAE